MTISDRGVIRTTSQQVQVQGQIDEHQQCTYVWGFCRINSNILGALSEYEITIYIRACTNIYVNICASPHSRRKFKRN